jgi:hypothetical protein
LKTCPSAHIAVPEAQIVLAVLFALDVRMLETLRIS